MQFVKKGYLIRYDAFCVLNFALKFLHTFSNKGKANNEKIPH